MSVRYGLLSVAVVCLAAPAWAGDHRADFEMGLVVNTESGQVGGFGAVVIGVTKEGPISPFHIQSKPQDGPAVNHARHPFAVVFAHGSTDGFKSYADTFGIRYTQRLPGTYPKQEPNAHGWGFALIEASTGFYKAPTGKHAIYSLSAGLEAYIKGLRWGLRAQVGYAWLDHDDVKNHVRITGGLVFRIPMKD